MESSTGIKISYPTRGKSAIGKGESDFPVRELSYVEDRVIGSSGHHHPITRKNRKARALGTPGDRVIGKQFKLLHQSIMQHGKNALEQSGRLTLYRDSSARLRPGAPGLGLVRMTGLGSDCVPTILEWFE